MKNVSQLKPGERGAIDQIKGDEVFVNRLLALGFTPGTAIRVVKRAPLGDPIEISIRGYNMMLRRREASRITLE